MSGHCEFSEFSAALLAPNQPEPTGLSSPRGAKAGARFDVYRNNVIVGLRDALTASFPVITKLLGATNFANIAGVYVRQHPPKTPLMMHYGADFPDFLAAFEPLAHLPYLADVARLEHALRQSYHAADSTPIPADALAQIAPDALTDTRLTLAPPVRVVCSDWPIYGIWHYNQAEGAPQPPGHGQSVLITRPEYDTQMTLISPAEAAFVQALALNATLADALTAASLQDAEFDLSGILSTLLSQAAICELG